MSSGRLSRETEPDPIACAILRGMIADARAGGAIRDSGPALQRLRQQAFRCFVVTSSIRAVRAIAGVVRGIAARRAVRANVVGRVARAD